ncbi:Mpo1-like protein [Neobacillus sp. D3-1R]|uniref:Mpo1-like protein n=1 Tax=Neobacillus sp. D3-1R TaxID=3445778 RepID=UPI003F9F156F
MNKNFSNFQEFWPFYLSQHRKKSTRAWHFVGTSFVFLFVILAIFFNVWYLLLAPIIAYGLAWYSHFFIEGNKPATFGHPFWSLRADFQMYGYILTGKLNQELKRHQI